MRDVILRTVDLMMFPMWVVSPVYAGRNIFEIWIILTEIFKFENDERSFSTKLVVFKFFYK